MAADPDLLACCRTCYTPSQHASAREELAAVEAAFDRLTEDQKEVLIQSRLLGRPLAEIAERLGKSPDAVRAILSRGLARLALLLELDRQRGRGSVSAHFGPAEEQNGAQP